MSKELDSIGFSHLYILRDCLLGAIFGIFLGFAIDIIFPEPKPAESTLFTIVMLLIQIVFDSLLLYYFSQFYRWIFKNDPDNYYAFTVFSVLIFLVQVQMLTRLNKLYKDLTKKNF